MLNEQHTVKPGEKLYKKNIKSKETISKIQSLEYEIKYQQFETNEY